RHELRELALVLAPVALHHQGREAFAPGGQLVEPERLVVTAEADRVVEARCAPTMRPLEPVDVLDVAALFADGNISHRYERATAVAGVAPLASFPTGQLREPVAALAEPPRGKAPVQQRRGFLRGPARVRRRLSQYTGTEA